MSSTIALLSRADVMDNIICTCAAPGRRAPGRS